MGAAMLGWSCAVLVHAVPSCSLSVLGSFTGSVYLVSTADQQSCSDDIAVTDPS